VIWTNQCTSSYTAVETPTLRASVSIRFTANEEQHQTACLCKRTFVAAGNRRSKKGMCNEGIPPTTQSNKLAVESVVTRGRVRRTRWPKTCMDSCIEHTSGLEDILVQHMPCIISDPHPRSLQCVREHGLRGDCEQDHVFRVTDDASFGWCSWKYGRPPLGMVWCYFQSWRRLWNCCQD
jgi:hypothetical protein